MAGTVWKCIKIADNFGKLQVIAGLLLYWGKDMAGNWWNFIKMALNAWKCMEMT